MKKITFTSLARLLGVVFLWVNLGHAPDLHAQTVPAQVTDLTAVASPGQVALSWVAAGSGATPTTHRIRITPPEGEVFDEFADGDVTEYLVRNLSIEGVYGFAISAGNTIGYGPPLATSVNVISGPTTAPGQVTGLTAVAGNKKVTLNWDAPDNGRSIIAYGITRTRVSDGDRLFDRERSIGSTTFTWRLELSNETEYSFRVNAITNVGNDVEERGPQSAEVIVTPTLTAPVVSDLEVTPKTGQVLLKWTLDNGGSPLTGYVLKVTPAVSPPPPPPTAATITTTTAGRISHTVKGLTNGITYTFSLSANNAVGDGPVVSVTATPATKPGPITNDSATPGDEQVTLRWTPPTDTGGVPLVDYDLTIVPGSNADGGYTPDRLPSGTDDEYIATGLTNGTTYQFFLTQRNAAKRGDGIRLVATPVAAAAPLLLPPGVVTDLTAIPRDEEVILNWTAPTDGETPTGYSVVTSDIINGPGTSSPTLAGDTTTYTVPNLTNGNKYFFRIIAKNGAVNGPATAYSVTATPLPKPAQVTGLTATPGNGQVTLNWTPQADLVSPITLYGIVTTPAVGDSDQKLINANSTTSTYTVSGLTNGTTYTFSLAATNASGDSPAAIITATPDPDTAPIAPAEVSNLTAAVSDGTVTLKWLTPANGGSSLTDYVLLITLPDGSAFPLLTQPSGTDITYTVSGLTNGTTYTFSLAATNAVGHGPAVSATATPAAAPGAVTNLTAVAGDGQIMLTWSAPELNGNTLTGYKVDYPGFPALTVDASATSTTITGLTNGVAYTFNVTPQSTNGDGVQVEVTATPVIKKLQTITFILSSAGVVGDTLDLSATASSMLEVTYSSSNSSIAEVGTGTEEGKLILKALGDATITASQAGDAQYTATEVTHTITVSESVVLSVDVKNTDIRVWPNPVATQLNISSGSRSKLSITLRNLTGQRLQEGELEGKGQIDVSLVPSGVYLLHIRTAEETTSYLIYKQ